MNEYQRKSGLGGFGETVVFEQLSRMGYECTYLERNFRCFDLEASKDGKKFIISIKARNHTNHKNDEKKDHYNLFFNKKKGEIDVDAEVKKAEQIARNRGAIAMWAAVRVDVPKQKYTIYWGYVADLKNKKSIPMSPADRRGHTKLAEDIFDPRVESKWSNVRSSQAVRSTPNGAPSGRALPAEPA
jgi:hypothetical protein